MTDPITPEERARWAEEHWQVDASHALGLLITLCASCMQGWPCATTRLLAALAEAERKAELMASEALTYRRLYDDACAALAKAETIVAAAADFVYRSYGASASELGLVPREALAEAKRERDRAESNITSMLLTIQGTVEGQPTSRVNFLQRLRQLVQAEARLRELQADRDRWVIEASEEGSRRLGSEARLRELAEALEITPDECGQIMHESWARTKRAQGFHHPNVEHPDWVAGAGFRGRCGLCHNDLVSWEALPESQKDINRHAFDDVLAEIRRRADAALRAARGKGDPSA